MDIVLVLSFLFFMTIFAGVGLASMFVKEDTTDDYLVAGRGMHPALAALSAVSTWNSGYMFIGFIGFTYMMGLNVLWLGVVSTIGQVVAWMWLYKFIQKEGQERGVRSLSSLVAEKAGAPEAKLAALLSVLFLSIYAAAQLTSGGKALFVMMGWNELIGILIGFVLVVAYCYAGGIRASIWTDAAQSCVMIVGSVILCWIALQEVDGFSGLTQSLEAQDPVLTKFLPPDLKFGFSLWAFAFFLGGLGVAGQPQVVSRVMTLGSDSDRKQAMIWFFVWQTPFIALMLIIGLVSRVLFTASDFDPELGLPQMAMETMPAFGIGMILASIFAATMSTADSQVLACTAAITDDIKPEWSQNHKTTKKVTLVVALFATIISVGGLYIPGGDSVFVLVVLAVYGLGGIFIPLLTIRWLGYKPDTTHSIAMMTAAFVGVIGWSILGFGGADGIFPSVPGMGAAFITHFIMNQVRNPDISPLGRYSLPDGRTVGVAAIVLLVPFSAGEVAYFFGKPDSTSMGGLGNYTVLAQDRTVSPLDEVQYLSDGETLEIFYTFDIEVPEGYQVVSLSLWWLYGETDETTDPNGPFEEASCILEPGDNAIDSTDGELNHGDFKDTDEGVNYGLGRVYQDFSNWSDSEDWGADWDEENETWIYNLTNITEKQIHENLNANGGHLGNYSMSIRLDVETGGNGGCPHSDDGEEINYLIEVEMLKYEIFTTEEIFPTTE